MKTFLTVLGLMSFALYFSGCNTAPKSETGRENLHDEVDTALARFEREDPDLKHFLDNSVGYAMFPDAGKAGFIAGGAYGKGEVFQGGRMIGYADIRRHPLRDRQLEMETRSILPEIGQAASKENVGDTHPVPAAAGAHVQPDRARGKDAERACHARAAG